MSVTHSGVHRKIAYWKNFHFIWFKAKTYWYNFLKKNNISYLGIPAPFIIDIEKIGLHQHLVIMSHLLSCIKWEKNQMNPFWEILFQKVQTDTRAVQLDFKMFTCFATTQNVDQIINNGYTERLWVTIDIRKNT